MSNLLKLLLNNVMAPSLIYIYIYYFPELFFVLFSQFCSVMMVWGLEFWVWDLGFVFLGSGFQLIDKVLEMW